MREFGASLIGGILGISRFFSPLEAWREIVYGKVYADSPEMALGRALEPLILDEWQRNHPGAYVTDRQSEFRRPEAPWLFGHVDAIGHVPGPTGERCVVLESKWASAPWEQVPPDYYVQIQAYLWLTGLESGYLLVRTPHHWTQEFNVVFDPVLWEEVLKTLQAWYDAYLAPEPPVPPPPTTPAERRAVALERLPKQGIILRPDQALDLRIRRVLRAKEAVKRLQARIEEAEAALLEAMVAAGASKVESASGWSATVVEREGAVKWKEVARDLGADERPDIVERYRGAPTKYLLFRAKKGGVA